MKRILLGLVLLLFACSRPVGTGQEPVKPRREGPAVLALLRGIPGTVFLPTPLVPQSQSFSCGSAAMQSLLAYYGDVFREGQLQRLLGSDPENGTSFRPMKSLVQLLNVAGGREKAQGYPACEEDTKKAVGGYQKECVGREPAIDVNTDLAPGNMELVPADKRYTLDVYPGTDATNGLTAAQLDANIAAGRPVMILLQAWPEEATPGWEDGWESGHFVLVIGYDATNYYLADPSTTGTWAFLPRADLVRRWHDIDAVRINGKVEQLTTTHFAFVLSRKQKFGFTGGVPAME